MDIGYSTKELVTQCDFISEKGALLLIWYVSDGFKEKARVKYYSGFFFEIKWIFPFIGKNPKFLSDHPFLLLLYRQNRSIGISVLEIPNVWCIDFLCLGLLVPFFGSFNNIVLHLQAEIGSKVCPKP